MLFWNSFTDNSRDGSALKQLRGDTVLLLTMKKFQMSLYISSVEDSSLFPYSHTMVTEFLILNSGSQYNAGSSIAP